MNATDTPGDSAFKTSGASSPTSMVRFSEIKSENYNSGVFHPHATGSLLYSQGRIKESMQGYVKPILTGFPHKQPSNTYKVTKDGTLRFGHSHQPSKFASNSNLPKFMGVASNYSKSNKNRPVHHSQNWKSGSGGYCMNGQG